ncbi:hypothetical protein ADU59_24255 [Pararhizobium polonicum]|uniref:Uncharacterized protein n=1 Tax=Pararhizobium polonicum TaxID=1612624 RepID=A0A1C7NZC2_9HYPH|nr:hypothetical protein ADU59_24255 [Pararhizobium polonicum]
MLHNGKNRVEDGIELFEDIRIPETEDMIALALQEGCSFLVMLEPHGRCVLAAVEFDDQADLMADKISKVWADGNLAAEMGAVNRNTLQMPPEFGFSIRGTLAQATAIGDFEAVEF